tara:strand:- start:410 stop:547 length:138 start_codon:yes stop_codon:yes gene_type:complete
MLVIFATIIGSVTLLYLFPNVTMLFAVIIGILSVRWLLYNDRHYE